ncbi:hypothetical protein [Pseudomonas sp. SDO55104_S430]
MDNESNRTQHSTRASIVLPALSPPFINADDAARFAHEAIGKNRDKEYGGLILQGEGGRFFATKPIGGNLHVDFKKLLTVDAKGNFIHPAGYTCYGLYNSHPNVLEQVKKKYPALPDDAAEVALNFFTDGEKAFMIRHRDFAKAFYLSGGETCLLKYMPSGSPEEDSLALELKQNRPSGNYNHLEEIIDELAQAGALSVVVPNELWGDVRGRFVGPWVINEPANTSEVETEQPFCTPILDQPIKVIDKMMNTESAAAGIRFMGVILKAQGKNEYVGTFPVRDLPSIASMLEEFPVREAGGRKLPSGFRIDGFYAVSPAKPVQIPAKQAWLYKNFFSPAELADLIEQSRKDVYLQEQGRALTLYQRTETKALLSYTCSGSEAETALMAGGGETLQNALKSGALSPFEFVLQVAAAGRLSVLQAGGIWDKAGVVGQNWRPFERIHQSLSPAFLTADDAARHVHYQMNARRDIDQLGYVLERSDGKFFATAPVSGDQWKKDANLPFAGGVSDRKVELPGYRYTAVYNASSDVRAKLKAMQPGWSNERIALHTSLPSLQHLETVTSGRDSITTLYNSGPDESLIKYVRGGTQQERNFSTVLDGAVKTGEIGVQFDGYDGTAETLVKKLVSIGELTVLNSSPVWKGSRGKVPSTWVAFEPFVSDAPVAPAMSWVFQNLETGAQWVHDLMRAKPEVRQVAFILKSQKTDDYVVTDPVVVDTSKTSFFSALQAFAANDQGSPSLPAGYELQAVCYQSLPDTHAIPTQRWLYESFISATDFAAAVGTARLHKRAGLALYLSTRDGAQLRYGFSGSTQESRLYGVDPHGVVTDSGEQRELEKGTLTPEAFVWRVAAVGALSVVRTGKLWDVEGEVGLSWVPFAGYPKQRLSPAFLTADDAARYAHELIGDIRDYEFCGYVMEREDGRFVATEPWAVGPSGRFAPGYVYPVDASGRPILPEHHALRGVYASRLALSLYDPQRMKRHSWTREQASIDGQLFSDGDLHAILQNRQHAMTAWLSAAEDALIAYDISGSADENALLKEVAPAPGGSRMAQDLASGASKPEDIVKQLAAAGGLRVVIASELWGARGMIPEWWKAFPAPRDAETPEQVAFGAIFNDADAAARDAHERLRRSGPDQTGFAFVLKHTDKDEYVVSETLPASDSQPLFSRASLFKTDDAGEFMYPASFKPFALFYARLWLPKNLGATEQWLGQHFTSSRDLYEGFFEARRLRAKDENFGLPVYLSTLDRALLKYQSPNSTTLFDARVQPSGVNEDVHSQLQNGQLQARDFIDRVISQSWLTVVQGNDCWGPSSTSRLNAEWKPYSRFTRRALTAAYTNQADAVRHVERMLGADRDQTHGGLVLKRTDGLFVATEPLPVVSENFDPKWILPDEDVASELLAPGCKIVARYRSRVANQLPFLVSGQEREVYRDFFSTDVLATALASGHLWTHEYLLGAQGSILSFTLQDEDHALLSAAQKSQLSTRLATLESQLAPSNDTPHDPLSNLIERRMRSGAGTPVEWVDQLIGVGRVQVVQSSSLWGPAQKLSAGWQLLKNGYQAPESVRFATADRALSPAFCHMDDAVRHAHGRAGKREHWSFGLVLTSQRLGHAVTSLPVTADDLRFPSERIFPRGQLPTGYQVQGIYLCAPARQPDELPSSEVYRSFIPPTVLLKALSAVEVIDSGAVTRFQSLYLSCADGALLKYDAAGLDSDLQTHSRLTAYVKSLQGDGNPAEYIRKVAGNGRLEVLVRSATWATVGRVGSTWGSGKVEERPVSDDQPLTLGPLFAHPDDAARHVWRNAREKAALGVILRDGKANFVATEPLDDAGPTVALGPRDDTPAFRRLFAGVMFRGYSRTNPGKTKKYPAGYEVMGVQQLYKVDHTPQRFSSRFEEALYRNFVAHDEIRACIALLNTYEIADSRYYLTPRQGALLAYKPSYLDGESKVLLDDWYDVEKGVTRSKLQEVFNTLILSGRLDVLEPDEFWNPRGQLTPKLLRDMSRRKL